MTFTEMELPEDPSYIAPDGSQIRVLPLLPRGGLAHCTLPPGQVTRAVVHRTVEEIWYILAGEGEIWRRLDGRDKTTKLRAGTCVTLPVGTEFQFRCVGKVPLRFVIVTMPPWPGPDEAVPVTNHWPTTV